MSLSPQLEREIAMALIQKEYGNRALLGNGMDMAGTALGYLDGLVAPTAGKLQDAVVRGVTSIDPKMPLNVGPVVTPKGDVINMLRGPQAKFLSKAAVGLGAVNGVLGAADVIAGDDSFANKAMDTTAMTIGGFLGAPGGPMGIAAGAGIGKSISDGAQWLFGDKKTAEQRRIEEALIALRGGQI
jgi:hypothetical protein